MRKRSTYLTVHIISLDKFFFLIKILLQFFGKLIYYGQLVLLLSQMLSACSWDCLRSADSRHYRNSYVACYKPSLLYCRNAHFSIPYRLESP